MKANQMNKLIFRPTRLMLMLSFVAINLAACSMATTSAQWAEPDDLGGEFTLWDDSVNQWSKKVSNLPLELHGSWPTPATLAKAGSANATPASQRVVIYIDGAQAPERDDFCAVTKSFRNVANSSSNQQVTLRAALCDGPRIVSFARKSFDRNAQPNNAVASIESALVNSLHPPFNFLDVDD